MSQHIKHNSSSRFTLSMRVVAMAVAVMAAAPTWTNAAEPTKSEAMQMPSEQKDHSKMMKQMGGMSMTGDVDYDFAANMRMHHQWQSRWRKPNSRTEKSRDAPYGQGHNCRTEEGNRRIRSVD